MIIGAWNFNSCDRKLDHNISQVKTPQSTNRLQRKSIWNILNNKYKNGQHCNGPRSRILSENEWKLSKNSNNHKLKLLNHFRGQSNYNAEHHNGEKFNKNIHTAGNNMNSLQSE